MKFNLKNNFLTLLSLGLVGLLFPDLGRAQSLSAVIEGHQSHTHLELSGRKDWKYDLNKKEDSKGKSYFELLVEQVNPEKLRKILSFKSDFIVKVSEGESPAGKTLLQFYLKNNEIDGYDYLTEDPSRLIVDFYPSPTSTIKKSSIKETKKLTAKKTSKRIPSSDSLTVLPSAGEDTRKGIFDGADPIYDRFALKDYEIKEESVFRNKDRFYLDFPFKTTEFEILDQIRLAENIYEIKPKETEENRMARLLLKLYDKKKTLVYLKTLGWWKQKFPDSDLNENIDFMTADLHRRDWEENNKEIDFEHAVQAYQMALKKHPSSVLAERVSLLLGDMSERHGNYLGAFQSYQEHENKIWNSPKKGFSNDLARLGEGRSSMNLNQYEDAIARFTKIENTSIFPELKAQAAFMKAETYTRWGKYQDGISNYQEAIKKYPSLAGKYASAWFNQSESFFLLKNYRSSLDAHREFLKKFPSDSDAPFSLTRVGEILDYFGADPQKVTGAYLETSFRFGDDPKAIVAKIRLLSLRMKNIKSAELEQVSKQILDLSQLLNLPNLNQFATVALSEGYALRKDYETAISLLEKFYKDNAHAPKLDSLKARIVDEIHDYFRKEVDEGKYFKFFSLYHRYKDNWLKDKERIDARFSLARAYEKTGVYANSEKNYQAIIQELVSEKDPVRLSEFHVLQKIPNLDNLRLRLGFVQFQMGKWNDAFEEIKKISSNKDLSDPEDVERVTLMFSLFEKRGDPQTAIRYLSEVISEWKDKPQIIAGPSLQLSKLHLQDQKNDLALSTLSEARKKIVDSKTESQKNYPELLEQLKEIAILQNQPAVAISALEEYLTKFEKGNPIPSLRYQLGDLYLKNGEPKKAGQVWAELKGPRSEFWKKIADDKMKTEGWNEDYKKYLKRIPAMSTKE